MSTHRPQFRYFAFPEGVSDKQRRRVFRGPAPRRVAGAERTTRPVLREASAAAGAGEAGSCDGAAGASVDAPELCARRPVAAHGADG